MKSTGEVMGIDADFGTAFAKSQTAAYGSLPTSGSVFVSVANKDKRSLIFPVKRLADLGFPDLATEGTAAVLRRKTGSTLPGGAPSTPREKLEEGERTIVEMIRDGEVDMVINMLYDSSAPKVYAVTRSAARPSPLNIPCVTTVQGASAAVQGIEAAIRGDIGVQSLQALHERLRSPAVVAASASGSASS